MTSPPDHPLDLKDNGLTAAEAETLRAARHGIAGDASVVLSGGLPATLANALETLGRLRLRGLLELGEDGVQTEELLERVRIALERHTRRIIVVDELELADTHRLKDLVASFVALGGPDHDAKTAETHGRALEAERALATFEDLVDEVLDAVDPSTAIGSAQAASIITEGEAFAPLRDALRRLAQVRGRA